MSAAARVGMDTIEAVGQLKCFGATQTGEVGTHCQLIVARGIVKIRGIRTTAGRVHVDPRDTRDAELKTDSRQRGLTGIRFQSVITRRVVQGRAIGAAATNKADMLETAKFNGELVRRQPAFGPWLWSQQQSFGHLGADDLK